MKISVLFDGVFLWSRVFGNNKSFLLKVKNRYINFSLGVIYIVTQEDQNEIETNTDRPKKYAEIIWL